MANIYVSRHLGSIGCVNVRKLIYR